MSGESTNYHDGNRAQERSFAPAPYQSGSRPVMAQKPRSQVAEPVVPARLKYQAPFVSTVAGLDLTQLYKNSINPHNPEAFESGEVLAVMARAFFEKLNIPIMSQRPVLAMSGGRLVMKGLLLNPEIMEAFANLFPHVVVAVPDNKILYEVTVNLRFFERTVLGEDGVVRKETQDRANAALIEA